MSSHGRIACTPDPAHGHLSGCDDRGDAVVDCDFPADQAVENPPAVASAPASPSLLEREGLFGCFHQHGYAHVDVFAPVGVAAGAVGHSDGIVVDLIHDVL